MIFRTWEYKKERFVVVDGQDGWWDAIKMSDFMGVLGCWWRKKK